MPSLGRVLIVEDQLLVAQMLRELLTSLGYESDLSPDGRDAMRRVRTYRPDVVLLDLNLPDTSGAEVLEVLRRDFPEMAVVVVTGNQDEATARGTLAQGAFDYVTKPFAIEVLEKVLRAALVHRQR